MSSKVSILHLCYIFKVVQTGLEEESAWRAARAGLCVLLRKGTTGVTALLMSHRTFTCLLSQELACQSAFAASSAAVVAVAVLLKGLAASGFVAVYTVCILLHWLGTLQFDIQTTSSLLAC